MAKKGVDAEALKKHHFWILLGGFAVLWLVAVVLAKVTAADAKKKAWTEAKTKIDGALKAGPKTEAYQKPWNEHGEKFSKHKDVIWKDAWNQQYRMYSWPDVMPDNARPTYPDDYFAPHNNPGGPFTNITLDQNNRNAFKRDWYPTQFPPLLNFCEPAEFNGGFLAIFPMQQWDTRGTPTREEIWLAQEDFWVRREMLFMIREAMDAMAWLKDVTPKEVLAKEQERLKKKEKPADGVELKRVFRNSNWELTLLFERDQAGRTYVIRPDSTIKNVNPNNRTLMLAHPKSTRGLPFRLAQNLATAPLEISGEPLAGGTETQLKREYKTTPVDVTKPFDVVQELAWENSPIRRIDALSLAHHSHRTILAPLKVNEDMKKLDPDPEPEAAATPSGEGGGGGMMSMLPPPGAGGGLDGKGGVGGPADATPVNRIDRARYVQVTPQCRHLPVAMRLVVEQAHVHDVLAAVANSRLRIQITQATVTHAPDVSAACRGRWPPPKAPGQPRRRRSAHGHGHAGHARPGGSPGAAGGRAAWAGEVGCPLPPPRAASQPADHAPRPRPGHEPRRGGGGDRHRQPDRLHRRLQGHRPAGGAGDLRHRLAVREVPAAPEGRGRPPGRRLDDTRARGPEVTLAPRPPRGARAFPYTA
ncbi:MAG: hypothetical protein U0797_23685 [Gemmataceae bacterium]